MYNPNELEHKIIDFINEKFSKLEKIIEKLEEELEILKAKYQTHLFVNHK